MKNLVMALIGLGVWPLIGADLWNLHQGVKAYAQKDYDQAKIKFEKLLVKNPDRADYLVNMGTVLYQQEKYEQAGNYFERALQNGEETLTELQIADLYFKLGKSYAQQSKWEQAKTAFEEGLKFDPQNAKALHNLEIIKQIIEQDKLKQSSAADKDNQSSQSDKQTENKSADENSKPLSKDESKSDIDNSSSAGDKPQLNDGDQNDVDQDDGRQNEGQDKGESASPEVNQAQKDKLSDEQRAYLAAVDRNDSQLNAELIRMHTKGNHGAGW